LSHPVYIGELYFRTHILHYKLSLDLKHISV